MSHSFTFWSGCTCNKCYHRFANIFFNKLGYGISTAVGIGGDPIIGLAYKELLSEFQKDDETKAIVMIGEIGGSLEVEAAKFIKDKTGHNA